MSGFSRRIISAILTTPDTASKRPKLPRSVSSGINRSPSSTILRPCSRTFVATATSNPAATAARAITRKCWQNTQSSVDKYNNFELNFLPASLFPEVIVAETKWTTLGIFSITSSTVNHCRGSSRLMNPRPFKHCAWNVPLKVDKGIVGGFIRPRRGSCRRNDYEGETWQNRAAGVSLFLFLKSAFSATRNPGHQHRQVWSEQEGNQDPARASTTINWRPIRYIKTRFLSGKVNARCCPLADSRQQPPKLQLCIPDGDT